MVFLLLLQLVIVQVKANGVFNEPQRQRANAPLPSEDTELTTTVAFPHKHFRTFPCKTYGVTDEVVTGTCLEVFVMRHNNHSFAFKIETEMLIDKDPLHVNKVPEYTQIFTAIFNIDHHCFPLPPGKAYQWYNMTAYMAYTSWMLVEVGFQAGLCQIACQFPVHGDVQYLSGIIRPVGDVFFTEPHCISEVNHVDVITFNSLRSTKTNICHVEHESSGFRCDKLVIGYAIMFVLITLVIALVITTISVRASRDKQRLKTFTPLIML